MQTYGSHCHFGQTFKHTSAIKDDVIEIGALVQFNLDENRSELYTENLLRKKVSVTKLNKMQTYSNLHEKLFCVHWLHQWKSELAKIIKICG